MAASGTASVEKSMPVDIFVPRVCTGAVHSAENRRQNSSEIRFTSASSSGLKS